MQRRRGLAVGLAGAALAVALVVREVRIQGSIVDLRDSIKSQNGRLDEAVQGQRALAAQIGRLVQELMERRASPATSGVGSSAAPSSEVTGGPVAVAAKNATPAVPSPEDIENVRKGQGLLDRAVASARWTDGDRNDFRVLLGRLPPDERHELTRRLVTAINDRRLALELSGPPF